MSSCKATNANPLYAGFMMYGDELYPGEHPRLIDESTFRHAERILAGTSRELRLTGTNPDYVLRGLLRCGLCGEAMCPGSTTKKNGISVSFRALAFAAPTSATPTSATPTSATPTSATLISAAPTSKAPTSAAPTYETPTFAAPTYETPTSEAPTSAAPTSATPTSTTPTSATLISAAPYDTTLSPTAGYPSSTDA